MRYTSILVYILLYTSCTSQTHRNTDSIETSTVVSEQRHESAVDIYYRDHHKINGQSVSSGTVSNGTLSNGTLLPFAGSNYHYFDSTSYLSGRAFTHEDVAKTIQNTYENLEKISPRMWGLMELSNEHGGKMSPHRTHQNGMSVDLMTPLLRDDKPCYTHDYMGATHYLLEFDDEGKLTNDPSVQIDFDAIGLHLLELNKEANKNGLTISKVIFKMELKDELYNSAYGRELKNSGIYITTQLTPLINSLHDDHYHVDFKRL